MVDSKKLEKKITLGFKIMSGFHVGGISKDHMDKLGKKDGIWDNEDLEKLVNDTMTELIKKNPLLSFWNNWNIPLTRVTSEAIGLNFLFLTALDYKIKGNPPTGVNLDKFHKNAMVLFDQSVYEYILSKWKGASDGLIVKNIQQYNNSSIDVLNPVDQNKWDNLIDEIIEGKIDSKPYTSSGEDIASIEGKIKLLLYYYYCLAGINAPDKTHPAYKGVHFDHIIPKSVLKVTTEVELKLLCSNIVNLAIIPSSANESKNDKKLTDINDSWVKKQVTIYSEIQESDFKNYNKPEHIKDLKIYRGDLIKKVFHEKRSNLLTNYPHH